jgi:hypothetical protein
LRLSEVFRVARAEVRVFIPETSYALVITDLAALEQPRVFLARLASEMTPIPLSAEPFGQYAAQFCNHTIETHERLAVHHPDRQWKIQTGNT